MSVDVNNPIRRFQAVAVCTALKARVVANVMVNTRYTPRNMVNTASLFTGKQYTATKKGMTAAHNDLAELLGRDKI